MAKKVYLVGAGPGDPGLLTVKGQRIILQADVIVYDNLVSDEILALASNKAELIYVGKIAGNHTLKQEEINALLVDKASEGKLVVRLKGGDPFVFGRGAEEALFLLNNGIKYEIIPGITSAIAVPAYAGIPVTHRDLGSSFAVITGHEKPGKVESSICWEKVSTGVDTLVFLMGVGNLPNIVDNLLANGRKPDTAIALIRRGTMVDQQIVTGTLEDIIDRAQAVGFIPPAVIVVGSTVSLQEKLSWFNKGPLQGKKIIVTRPQDQAQQLINNIKELGGEALPFPTIKINELSEITRLYNQLSNFTTYDWLVFTSANAVEIFFRQLRMQKIDIRNLAKVKIATIGAVTAKAVEAKGMMVDLVPKEYIAEDLIKELSLLLKGGEKVLLPRAWGARRILKTSLEDLGVFVDEIPLYASNIPDKIFEPLKHQIEEGKADYLTFTSSSTVTNFIEIMGKEIVAVINKNLKTACIGPITAETARENGLRVDIIAPKYTVEALLQAILEDVQRCDK